MRLLVCMAWCLMLAPHTVQAQQENDFPYPMAPGDRYGARTVGSKDTLLVVTYNQLNSLLLKGDELELSKREKELLLKKISLLEKKSDKLQEKNILFQTIIAEKDTLIRLNREGYMHYRNLWDRTNHELEKAEIKNTGRWKLFGYGFYTGTIVTIIGGTLAIISAR